MLQPDDLDRRIMRELESPGSLRWDIRASYASIAKKIGVDEETVRKRIVRVRESGLVLGWQLVVNPHLIGRDAASVEFEVNASDKIFAIDQFKLMDGIISVLNFYGKGLQVGIYYDHEKALNRQISLMESICGCNHTHLWRVPFPDCEVKMTATDWLLLDVLRKDPRRKLVEVASETRVSSRTLKRRLDRMEEGYAFFLHAAVDFKKLGGLAYRMLVYCNNKKKSYIDELILTKINNVEWSYTFAVEYSMFVIHCENTAEIERISSLVKDVDGIKEVKMDIIEEQITVQDWIQDEISNKIATKHS